MADEKDLLARFIADHSPADFGVLMEHRLPKVWSVCRQILRDEHDAEDATQAVFLLLSQKAGDLRGQERMLGIWLHRTAVFVAQRLLRDRIHRRKREEVVAAMREASEEFAHEVEPEESQLQVAVEALPTKFREVVILRYFDGKSPTEIAEMLGRPLKTVESRLTFALAKLRAKLRNRKQEVSATLLLGLLEQQAVADTGVPAHLAAATQNLCFPSLATAGSLAAAVANEGSIAALAQAAAKALLTAKIKAWGTTALNLAFGALLGAGIFYAIQAAQQENKPPVTRSKAGANASRNGSALQPSTPQKVEQPKAEPELVYEETFPDTTNQFWEKCSGAVWKTLDADRHYRKNLGLRDAMRIANTEAAFCLGAGYKSRELPRFPQKTEIVSVPIELGKGYVCITFSHASRYIVRKNVEEGELVGGVHILDDAGSILCKWDMIVTNERLSLPLLLQDHLENEPISIILNPFGKVVHVEGEKVDIAANKLVSPNATKHVRLRVFTQVSKETTHVIWYFTGLEITRLPEWSGKVPQAKKKNAEEANDLF